VDPPPERRPEPAWDLPHPVVGFLGRLDPPKGIEDLLEAAGEVEAQVVVVGAPWAGDEAYVASLHRLAEEHAPGRVHFVGSLPDPWTALAGMDVLAVPSRLEPFGRVAAEAQLAGVPVVAADAGGLPDAVTDDVDGLLFPVGDVAALAHALRRVLGEPGLRERLVAAGEISGQRFRPVRHAARMAALYDDLTSQ
jgi:glycogen(starch) synthase